jgi:dipeptidyl aminopeptidase/acylaminoacyl peptidase
MKSRVVLVLGALLTLPLTLHAQEPGPNLLDARKGFKTKLVREERDDAPLDAPPPELFSIVKYPGPLGEMSAYLSKPKRGKKAPAIIWLTGGFPVGGGGALLWEEPDRANEQSAQAYRHAGVVMMYPTVRGGAGAPGVEESFLGEVDDVLAALEYLRTVDGVDPQRIYLGGHSTGGTLALLVAAATDKFRAVFSFGPVTCPTGYGQDHCAFDIEDEREADMRAPMRHLDAIRSPTYVIEGSEEGNAASLEMLRDMNKNDRLKFVLVTGATHFTLLAPLNDVLAREVAKSKAGEPFSVEPAALLGAFKVPTRSPAR